MSCHSAHRVPIRESGHWGYAWFPLHCRSSWAAARAALPARLHPPPRSPINAAGGWSDSPFISGDGQRLYFMYSRYDFAPWVISAGAQPPVLSGPDRPGLHHSTNPFDELDICVATRNPDRTWAEAVNLGLNGAYADSGGSNIVTANRNPDGTWGPAADPGPGINDHSAGLPRSIRRRTTISSGRECRLQ